MKAKPLVSILTVTYNQKEYISEAIESFLKQKTNFPFEIVIGDDCSTDGTKEILTKYKEQNPDKIRIVSNEINIGPFENRIQTRNNCKGKYIALCDGDDYWIDSLKLQKQIDFLEANPHYAMIYSDIKMIDEKGHNIETTAFYEQQKTKYKSGEIFFDLLQGNFINLLTVCYRLEAIKEITEHINIIEKEKWYIHDYWYWLQIAKSYKIKFLNEKTAAYRIHHNGISRNNSYLKKRTPFVLFDALSLIDKAKINNPDKRRIIANRLISMLRTNNVNFSIKLKAFRYMIKFSLLSSIIERIYSRVIDN